MKKRILSTLLAISMLFSFFPNTFLTAYADDLGEGYQLISALELTVNADGTINGDSINITPTNQCNSGSPTYILILSAEVNDDSGTLDTNVDFNTTYGEITDNAPASFAHPAFLYTLESFDTPNQSYAVAKAADNNTVLSDYLSGRETFGYSTECLNSLAKNQESSISFSAHNEFKLQALVVNQDHPYDSYSQKIPFTIKLDEETHVSLPEGGGSFTE